MGQSEYVIYGSEYSPFSVKVRSYFRYKNIPHEWRPRTLANMADFNAHAKLPLVPLVIQPDGSVLQDSTPIIERMEDDFHHLSISPADPACNFLSALIEEYADEWLNKPMFHYRWWREIDQSAVAHALATSMMPDGAADEIKVFAEQVRARMVPRLSYVGSSSQNAPVIEASLIQVLQNLERHLGARPYMFGGCPALADFGLFGQLYCCTQQPTTATLLENYPAVTQWIDLMITPVKLGEWENWESVSESLIDLVQGQIGALYLPWAVANAQALEKEEAVFTVVLNGDEFTQSTMKYAGRSFAALKGRFQTVADRSILEEFLLKTDCLKPLVTESW